MSILYSPWTSQPQQAVGIDWSNPITRGLVLDVDFNGGVRDRVSGMIATPTVGRATPITTSQGVAARFSSTVYSFGDVELFNGTEAAWQILEIPDSLTQAAGIVNKRTNANTQNSFSMGYNYTSNEFEVDVGNPAGAAGAAYRFSRAGFSTSGNNIVANINVAQSAGNRIRAWRNGASLGVTVSTDSVGSVITNTTAPLEIGRVNSATNYYAGNLLIVRAWNRVLSDAEVISLSQNPWQIFKPLPRRIFVPVAAGGGTTAVTSDHNASYTITGSVAADASAAYAIRAAVTADATASYTLRTAAQSDQAAAYAIRAAVASDLSGSYAIQTAGTVTAGLDAAYAVRSSVAGDISVGYQIAAAVQAEVAAAYAVRAAVQKDLSAWYSVSDSVTNVASDIVCTYAINGVSPSYPSAESIAAAVWQRAIEDGMSSEQMLRIMFSALAGVTSGVGSNTERYMALDGVTPRIEATFDANNNRTSITLDGA